MMIYSGFMSKQLQRLPWDILIQTLKEDSVLIYNNALYIQKLTQTSVYLFSGGGGVTTKVAVIKSTVNGRFIPHTSLILDDTNINTAQNKTLKTNFALTFTHNRKCENFQIYDTQYANFVVNILPSTIAYKKFPTHLKPSVQMVMDKCMLALALRGYIMPYNNHSSALITNTSPWLGERTLIALDAVQNSVAAKYNLAPNQVLALTKTQLTTLIEKSATPYTAGWIKTNAEVIGSAVFARASSLGEQRALLNYIPQPNPTIASLLAHDPHLFVNLKDLHGL